ncbi:MAG: glutamate mutase L [Verrucomicrobiae bacterium]|nr:glutamate mutase L [Verrucomicrobiae bacterium]
MTQPTVISIDIGSTFTKGALFSVAPEHPRLLRRAACPTTPDDLKRGLARVLATLCQLPSDTPLDKIRPPAPVRFCSSAKGGLAIAAIGIVPDLTVQLARLAAMSAGGKVIKSFAYSLTQTDIAELERAQPDIVLFCGGTDGGNTAYILGNAARLANSRYHGPIIYAGNRDVAERVTEILRSRPVTVVPNLMPEIGVLNLEPVREKIREIFLEEIVVGKGLSDIVQRFETGVRPTPLGVYELMETIPRLRPEWDNLCAIDLGGATTDFYSNTESFLETDSVLLKGIREPRLKRTVEGDLGLRVSAPALLESAADYLAVSLKAANLTETDLNAYVARLKENPGHIAATTREKLLDDIMAEACVYHAARRHAGLWRETYTPQGRIYIQSGKDLRRVQRIIGSGGYLAGCTGDGIMRRAFRRLRETGPEIVLAPENPAFYADAQGLFPLLGNLVSVYPEAAVALALESLKPLEEKTPC